MWLTLLPLTVIISNCSVSPLTIFLASKNTYQTFAQYLTSIFALSVISILALIMRAACPSPVQLSAPDYTTLTPAYLESPLTIAIVCEFKTALLASPSLLAQSLPYKLITCCTSLVSYPSTNYFQLAYCGLQGTSLAYLSSLLHANAATQMLRSSSAHLPV